MNLNILKWKYILHLERGKRMKAVCLITSFSEKDIVNYDSDRQRMALTHC